MHSPLPQPGVMAPIEESASIQENIQYGLADGQKLLLDIYLPGGMATKYRPAILLIHGGSWMEGDKGALRGMGQFLARNGFVAVAINYRLLHDAANRWPAQLDDAQRSVRWLRENAAKYEIDRDHIGAFGHSAGAQMAALLGMEDTRDNSDSALAKYSSRVQAVIDVSGPTDFTTDRDADGDAFLANILGATFEKNPELWRQASPVFHVSKTSAPFLIVHGTRDESVNIKQAQELYDKLHESGVPATFVKVDDMHTFQTQEARRKLAFESLAFFDRYLMANN